MGTPTYDRMAPIYERLTDAYSLGCVPRAKRHQLATIEAGMDVLYLGMGPGGAALAAADKGARVTGVDVAQRMVDIASARFEAAGLSADLIAADLFDFRPARGFDVVVANFLLDCFDDDRRRDVVRRIHDLLRPGGRALVADTGRPRGSAPGRVAWRVYHGIAYATTYLQGITPWLPVMDLDRDLEHAGLRIDEHRHFRPWRGGPVLFEAVSATRPER